MEENKATDNKNKKHLLEPSETVTPEKTFARNSIYTIADKPTKKVPKNSRGKRSSISCFQDTKNKLQALNTILMTKNVDEVIEKMIDSYLDVMSEEEVKEFRLIVKSLDKRTIKK